MNFKFDKHVVWDSPHMALKNSHVPKENPDMTPLKFLKGGHSQGCMSP